MVVRGIEFKTAKAAYRHFGITKQGMNMFKHKDDYSSNEELLEAYLNYRLELQAVKEVKTRNRRKTLLFKGEKYSSFKSICKKYNIIYATFGSRVGVLNIKKNKEEKLKLLEKMVDSIANVDSKEYYIELATQYGLTHDLTRFRYYARRLGVGAAVDKVRELNWTTRDRVVNTPELFNRFSKQNKFLLIDLPSTNWRENNAIR